MYFIYAPHRLEIGNVVDTKPRLFFFPQGFFQRGGICTYLMSVVFGLDESSQWQDRTDLANEP